MVRWLDGWVVGCRGLEVEVEAEAERAVGLLEAVVVGVDLGGAERPVEGEVEDDVVLAESLNILADLVRLTDGAELPAQTGGINGWMRFFGVTR